MNKPDYTIADCGCYVDSVRGRYCIDAIVQIAMDHGMAEPTPCTDSDCPRCAKGDKTAGDGSYSEWANCDYAGEIEDDCDDYMNAHFPVDGAYWGRSEQGDWGLWQTDAD